MPKFDYATKKNDDQRHPHPNQDRLCFADQMPATSEQEISKFYKDFFEGIKEQSQQFKNCGSTFVSLSYNTQTKTATTCNLGDSRAYAVLYDKKANARILLSLSEDMKPETPRFKEKVGAENVVLSGGCYRVDGLAMAGSFGDATRDYIIFEPEILHFDLSNLQENIFAKITNQNGSKEDSRKFELESFFVASDGFCDVETGFLKDSEAGQDAYFDHIYRLKYDEEKGYSFYQIQRQEDFLNATITKERIDGYFAQENGEKSNLDYSAKTFVDLARAIQSDDDITICGFAIADLEKQMLGRQPKNQQVTISLADGHGAIDVVNGATEPSEFLVQKFSERLVERFNARASHSLGYHERIVKAEVREKTAEKRNSGIEEAIGEEAIIIDNDIRPAPEPKPSAHQAKSQKLQEKENCCAIS